MPVCWCVSSLRETASSPKWGVWQSTVWDPRMAGTFAMELVFRRTPPPNPPMLSALPPLLPALIGGRTPKGGRGQQVPNASSGTRIPHTASPLSITKQVGRKE